MCLSRSQSDNKTAAILVSQSETTSSTDRGEVGGSDAHSTRSVVLVLSTTNTLKHRGLLRLKGVCEAQKKELFLFLILTDEFSRYFLILSGLLWVTTQIHDCFANAAHFQRPAVHRRKLKRPV